MEALALETAQRLESTLQQMLDSIPEHDYRAPANSEFLRSALEVLHNKTDIPIHKRIVALCVLVDMFLEISCKFEADVRSNPVHDARQLEHIGGTYTGIYESPMYLDVTSSSIKMASRNRGFDFNMLNAITLFTRTPEHYNDSDFFF